MENIKQKLKNANSQIQLSNMVLTDRDSEALLRVIDALDTIHDILDYIIHVLQDKE